MNLPRAGIRTLYGVQRHGNGTNPPFYVVHFKLYPNLKCRAVVFPQRGAVAITHETFGVGDIRSDEGLEVELRAIIRSQLEEERKPKEKHAHEVS